jgi:hypothetical protein
MGQFGSTLVWISIREIHKIDKFNAKLRVGQERWGRGYRVITCKTRCRRVRDRRLLITMPVYNTNHPSFHLAGRMVGWSLGSWVDASSMLIPAKSLRFLTWLFFESRTSPGELGALGEARVECIDRNGLIRATSRCRVSCVTSATVQRIIPNGIPTPHRRLSALLSGTIRTRRVTVTFLTPMYQ